MDSLEYDPYTDSFWYEDIESGEWIELTHEDLDGEIEWI